MVRKKFENYLHDFKTTFDKKQEHNNLDHQQKHDDALHMTIGPLLKNHFHDYLGIERSIQPTHLLYEYDYEYILSKQSMNIVNLHKIGKGSTELV